MKNLDTCKSIIDRISNLADKVGIDIADTASSHITLSKLPAIEKVLNYAWGNELNVAEYAKSAAQIASGNNAVKVIEMEAAITGNCRVDDWYGEGSGDMDIWIGFTAVIDYGFEGVIIGGAYLTDILGYSSDYRDATLQHMYIRRFKEV